MYQPANLYIHWGNWEHCLIALISFLLTWAKLLIKPLIIYQITDWNTILFAKALENSEACVQQ